MMNDIRKKEFFELMGEVKTIAENLNTVVIDEKIWKIQLQYTKIRDLIGRAEILLKHGFNDATTNTEIERPTEIDASFMENEGTGSLV